MQQCPTAKVIAAVNHDPAAIDCHKQNHPEVVHPINTITTQHRNYMVSISMSNHDTTETNITPISEEQKKLLTIMQQFGITDIKMRLLKTPELLQIMGFPIKLVIT